MRFRSTDAAGNVEATKKVAVKIDATAPVSSAAFAPANDDGWHNGTVPVVITSTDAGSGVKKLEWSLDGGAWTAYTTPVEVTGDGTHELLYRATDAAGNVEALKSAVVKIDGTKPTLLVSGIADGQLYGDSQDVRISWQAVDPTSGIKTTSGVLDGRGVHQRHPAGDVRAAARPARADGDRDRQGGQLHHLVGPVLRHHLVPGHAEPAGPVQVDRTALHQGAQSAVEQARPRCGSPRRRATTSGRCSS